MSLKLDGLEMFKKHRNKISESLDNKFIGREKETNAILDLLSKVDFVAITGPAGVGKSRLAVAVIERYAFANHDVKVLCLKSFGDYVSAVEEMIDDSKRYMFFIDDASDYKRITELLRCLKYHSNRNIKAIFTVRNYLKDCLDETMMCFYEIGPLSDVDDVLYSFILDLEIDIDTADSLLKDLGKKGFIKEFSD